MSEIVVKLLPIVLNFLSSWGRKPKTITVEKFVDRVQKVDREIFVEVEIEKIREVEVKTIVEKIVNFSKTEFEECLELLESIMNNGYKEIIKTMNKNNKTITVMACGPSGSGKSTILNKLFGTNYQIKKSTGDVTNEISEITTSPKYKEIQCIDSVGFLPTLSNIGKLFLLMFHLKKFPDYLLFPISNDRIVDILSLQKLVTSGFIQLLIVPFSSNTYHSTLEFLNQNKRDNSSDEEIEKTAIELSYHKTLLNEIESFLSSVGMSNNAKPLKSFDNNPFSINNNNNNLTMKELFLSLFFDKDGNFIKMKFEKYQNDLLKQDQNTTIAIIYGLLIDAIKTLPTHANINREKNEIITINECNFLKG